MKETKINLFLVLGLLFLILALMTAFISLTRFYVEERSSGIVEGLNGTIYLISSPATGKFVPLNSTISLISNDSCAVMLVDSTGRVIGEEVLLRENTMVNVTLGGSEEYLNITILSSAPARINYNWIVSGYERPLIILGIPSAILAMVGTGLSIVGLYRFFERIWKE